MVCRHLMWMMRRYFNRECSVVVVFSFLGLNFLNLSLLRETRVIDSALCASGIAVNTFVTGTVEQDAEPLIRYIRDNVMVPPDTRPYNLVNSNGNRFSRDNAERMLDFLFEGKKNGTFFEAGAFNGENISNTLYLEKHHSWTGLLVEASPENQKDLLNKHRKAWVARACISTSGQPEKISFFESGQFGWSEGHHVDLRNRTYVCPGIGLIFGAYAGEYTEVQGRNCSLLKVNNLSLQCFPLYSLLLASGITSIDFMSLDIEGGELLALQSLPFDKVDIKVLLVEAQYGTEKQQLTEEFLRSRGYSKLTDADHMYRDMLFLMDMLFIKEGLSVPIP